METRIPVRDAMMRRVVIANFDANAMDAAKEMTSNDVGSVIVMKDGGPVGIVTERDILRKLVSEDIKPSLVEVGELMSSPLIYASPDDNLLDAIGKMAKERIRRLPVIEEDKLVGILTDTDIISVSSEINSIQEELVEMSRERVIIQEKSVSRGICEKCGELSDNLEMNDGLLLCESCRDELFK
jgi:CBS domain-containing protein